MAGIGLGASIWVRKCRQNPITSWTTRVALAALTCGFDLISTKGFSHTLSADAETREELEASRSVTWLWDARKSVTFTPDFPEETIGLEEFERRFSSDTWWKENPHHPIAYMRGFLEKSRDGMEKIRSIPPALRHVRDDVVATAPADATEEEVDEYFRALENKK